MRIDWQKPLEAVHEDGRVVPMTYSYTDGFDHFTYESVPWKIWTSQGEPWGVDDGKGWHIRNVQPALSATKVDDALVERMVALVLGVAEWEPEGYAVVQLCNASERAIEARAIAALLPKPVDPDMIAAEKFVKDWEAGAYVSLEDAFQVALKQGRAK